MIPMLLAVLLQALVVAALFHLRRQLCLSHNSTTNHYD